MKRIVTAVALAGALSLPLVTGAAMAQDAAPEPPHGATPNDSGAGAAPMKSGGAMKGGAMMSKKSSKSMKKHK